VLAWVMPISGTRKVEHSVLTPLPVRSALPDCRHPALHENVTQTVLYFRYCIESLYRTYPARCILIHRPGRLGSVLLAHNVMESDI
jgi:hypothetical protein